MKKFLILPCIAVLAACSSNNETATVPVQPQPIVKPTVPIEKPNTENKQPEAKPVAPIYVTPTYVPTPPPPAPAPQPPQPPKQSATSPLKAEAASSNEKTTEAAKFFEITKKQDGKIELPKQNEKRQPATTNPIKAYEKDKSVVYMLDPAKFGFEYQTFGPVYTVPDPYKKPDERIIEGYLSTGIRYTPDENETFGATYHGVAFGTHNKKDNVVSRLQADLKWGADEKSLTVQTTESQVRTDDGKLVDRSGLDFTRTMKWDSNNKQFSYKDGGDDLKGYLYGDAAQEVGGTLKVDEYEGGFGAARAK